MQATQNPALHVNYTKGMVLGVDDFTQEYTYLANRDQWALRELSGYGTTSGLAVTVEDDGTNGPRVHVAKGTAVAPSGKLICVPQDFCAHINKWLANPKNADKIRESITAESPPLSPPAVTGELSLYLTLCYTDCTTMPVPIPGEPCRSEDQLMKDSRIADHFLLELRTEAPKQTEEDAIRDFVDWLKYVVVINTSPPPITNEKTWKDALKASAQLLFDRHNSSPPTSPPTLDDYMFGSPPSSLEIAEADLGAFLKVAFRFWVTDLRPLWKNYLCSENAKADDNCLLLARLEIPIVLAGSPTGVWQVDGNADAITIDESMRPCLTSVRLLQEWLSHNAAEQSITSVPVVSSPSILPTEEALSSLVINNSHIPLAIAHTDLVLDDTHYLIICTNGITITLPKCGLGNKGRVYIVKSQEGNSKLVRQPGDTIDGLANKEVRSKKALTLVSDGTQTWHVIATA
ncbi:MAG: hypothetical protein ACXWT1_04505 [Methylobacter sp.]